MDTGELRKRILRALDEARNDAAFRRSEIDQAQRAYEDFLSNVVVPLLRQAQSILRAEHQLFTVHAAAGSARLASDASAETFIEFALDASGAKPHVMTRLSLARGGKRVTVEERPLAADKPIQAIADDDVAAVLVTEIPRLLLK